MKQKLRESQTLIRISIDTKEKIRKLCKKTGYKQITVLEYLLSGKIDLKELGNQAVDNFLKLPKTPIKTVYLKLDKGIVFILNM